jgi:adenylate kinase family enzyme
VPLKEGGGDKMSSIFIYGRPGTGKSTLAASLVKLGYHVHFIDVDRKVETMKNLEKYIKDGSVTFQTLESPLVDGTLRQRVSLGPKAALLKQPKGYMELCDIIDAYENRENIPEDAYRTVLVTDSLSRVTQHMRRLLKWFKKGGDVTFHDWDFVLMNYEEYFDKFYNLQPHPFAHCIIIAHAKTERDEILQVPLYNPLIDGSMRDKASGHVEECYFTYTETSGPKTSFLVRTKPDTRVMQARSSRDLPNVIKSDFVEIFKGEKAPKVQDE